MIDGLVSYNRSHTGDGSLTSFTILLRDPGGEVVGGLLAEVYWGWLHVDALWVTDSLRGRGYGAKLMTTAEQEAVARGCNSAFLDTFSFQALPFYERLGYEVFGELVDFPPGHGRYFLRKSLGESSGTVPPDPSADTTAPIFLRR